MEKTSQEDFIIDQTQPDGEIDTKKGMFATQYQKYEESGIYTISDREGKDNQ